jgi:hypothetical protein
MATTPLPLNVTVYSFADLVFSMSTPVNGNTFTGSGQEGIRQITVGMTTTRTAHDKAADGAIMVSAIPGNNGTVSIEMQQTSPFHDFLLQWFNDLDTAMQNKDVSNWATASIGVRNIVDGTAHNAIGVSPTKIPDKQYSEQGATVTWELMAAQILNVGNPVTSN